MRGGRGGGGAAGELDLMNVSRILALGAGRLSGGRVFNHAVSAGGSAKEKPSRAWGEGSGRGGREVGFLMNVSRILALGGSICCVFRGSEALGSSLVRVLRVGEALGGHNV